MKPPRMIPLNVAVDKFATKRALDSLEPPVDIPNEKLEMTRKEEIRRLSSLVSNLAKEIRRPSLNRRRLFEHLCERIRRGELVAYGIRTKPSLGADPELVPSFLLRNADWDIEHDAVESAGHRYELIEVGRLNRAATVKPIEVRPLKKMGRPTKEAEIEEVVREVLADPSAPRNRKAQCDRIRERAVTLGKSVDVGYSDSTIKRLIVRVEDEARRSKVQK